MGVRGLKVRKIQHDELESLIALAEADEHVVIAPTHVMLKDDEIVGYWSLGGIPVVSSWFDSEKLGPRDSMAALDQMESLMDTVSPGPYLLMCADNSPFFEQKERLGYKDLFNTNLIVRQER